jgi:hypothetical protein
MLRHDLLVTDTLGECHLSLLDPPYAACAGHAFMITLLEYQVIDIPSVRAKQLALVRALPEMNALKIRHGVRGLATVVKQYPLRCQVVMRPDRSESVFGQDAIRPSEVSSGTGF